MITLRSGIGPFGMMDRMGLGVVYHVATLVSETTSNTQALESARYIDKHFIQHGHLGVASGQGFYNYPNPAFAEPGFISTSSLGGKPSQRRHRWMPTPTRLPDLNLRHARHASVQATFLQVHA